jgi:thioesterase domain-containing protein
MQTTDLEEYIYEHIPIVKTNNFKIQVLEENTIQVKGSYKEHINHRNSVFGGSLGTALTLSAWGYVRQLMEANNIKKSIIVIKKQEVEYPKPVTKDFISLSRPIDQDALNKALAMLRKFNKCRLYIEAYVTHENETEILTTFKGEFVVVVPNPS